MTAVLRKSNFSALAVTIFCTLLLTGCASSQAKLKAFQKSQGDKGFIYAQVNSVEPGINTKSACDRNFGGEKLKKTRESICGRLDELNVIYVSELRDEKLLTSNEIVPVSLEIKRGAIIKLDLEKQSPFRFIEIAALEPNENCKWVGSDNALAYDSITKAGSVALGVVSGLLLWPGIADMSREKIGGVECNGWSYKTAYREFLSKY